MQGSDFIVLKITEICAIKCKKKKNKYVKIFINYNEGSRTPSLYYDNLILIIIRLKHEIFSETETGVIFLLYIWVSIHRRTQYIYIYICMYIIFIIN